MPSPRLPRNAADPAPAGGPTISASEFKATCLDLMERVARERTSIVVTKRGVPVARLVPVDQPVAVRSRGILRGTVLRQGDLVTSDASDWPEAHAADPLGLPALPARRPR